MRIILHIARLATHMHQAHRQTGGCCGIQGAITTERAHIVDQPGTEPGRLTDHRWRRSIDRDDHIEFATDRLDDRRNALQFFKRRHRASARAGGLATDIDQGRTGSHHRLGMTQCRITLGETTAIGEGIGGDIEDTHDMGTGQIKNPVAARQPGRVLL
ncbi:hypothetical protein D3C76_1092680 [compost metagenome]